MSGIPNFTSINGVEWNREMFATRAEADAFVAGLEWGDDSPWTVNWIGVPPSPYEDDGFEVIFIRTEELEA